MEKKNKERFWILQIARNIHNIYKISFYIKKKLLTKKSVLNYLKRLLSSEALTLGQKKKKILFPHYRPGEKLFFLMM